ncbi:MAG: OadG family protein [Alphaproteobacteria bacterium]|nr:OadG family protein [Alphaproteobacteria bacterium]
MILQALWITFIGMAGVFGFLLFLIAGMAFLRYLIERTGKNNLDKIAIAIAIAQAQED